MKIKPYSSIIHSILISALTLAVIYLYISNNNLKKELSVSVATTMHSTELLPNDTSETNVSTIITFIGVGFALFAFLTFQSLKDLHHGKIKEVNKKHEEHEQKYIDWENRLKKLENNMLAVSSTMMSDLGDDLFKRGKISSGIYHLINSALQYSSRHCDNDEEKDHLNTMVKGKLILIDADITKSGVGRIEVDKEAYSYLFTVSQKIISNTNMECGVLLTKIINTLKVVDKKVD